MKVKRLDKNAKLPTKAYPGDLGYDFYALEDAVIREGKVTKVRTGIAIELPAGYGMIIKDRSSVATKRGILTCAGVIDNGYRGEILIAMYSLSGDKVIRAGDKIAQGILIPTVDFEIEEVSEVTETERNDNGFGSSDKKEEKI